MKIHSNFSLQKLNSFGFLSHAQYFVSVGNNDELVQAIKYANQHQLNWQILGGGSNVVLPQVVKGLTIQIAIMGKSLVSQTATHFYIDCGAGESWHDFVAWTLAQNYPGLENLALIPGTCGAAPIQNIGAYGAELSSLIDSVEVLDTRLLDQEQTAWRVLSNAQCEFSYRNSIFKVPPKPFIVTQVRFAIPKKWQANLSYAELANYFLNQKNPSAQDIFSAVVAIRSRKLPDPQVLGNAGSFFHNPVVNQATHNRLKRLFPDLVSYPYGQPQGEKQFKLAAGWLIDQCGLKAYRYGDCGVYDRQALVLVNYGNATGEDVLALAEYVKSCVLEKFGVNLTQEPINF